MIRNYLLVAWRQLWKNKAFSVMNVLGLSMGIACSLLILLWVKDEHNVDAFHVHKDRLYSMIQRAYSGDKRGIGYYTPGLLGAEMKKTLPEVESAVTYTTWGNSFTFRVGEKVLKQTGEFADVDFFKVFSFPLLEGSTTDALNAPDKVAVSRSMAVKLYGSVAGAMHQPLLLNNKDELRVAAVFEDVTAASSMQFDYVINWQYLRARNAWMDDFNSVAFYTAAVLREQTDPVLFRNKIVHFLDNLNTKQGPYYHVSMDMQRFDETYLHGGFTDKEIGGGRITYVWLMSVLAVFILLIACINFMNMSTAASLQRAKETGVRKAAGAGRFTLVLQFMCESVLFAVLALAVAAVADILVLPSFNQLTGKHIVLPYTSLFFWMQLGGLGLLTGLLAGIYPALVLSAFKPASVLKGLAGFDMRTVMLRKGLVVFQFTLCLLLITGSIVIWRQVQFVQDTRLGYSAENLVAIPVEGALVSRYELFKQRALQIPGVNSVTQSSRMITQEDAWWINDLDWDGKSATEKPAFAFMQADYDLVKTIGLELVEGRDFSRQMAVDNTGYLINETAARQMGYTQAVGKTFTVSGKRGTIIGVVKDYHSNSLHSTIVPMIIAFHAPEEGSYVFVKLGPGNPMAALSGLGALYGQLNPGFNFSYRFTDEAYQKLYAAERMTGNLSNGFMILAIAVSCIGLLGLSMFTAKQRSKEIGIRKVLGAGASGLFFLLSKEFLLLVLLAIVIATPLGYWFMHQWLQGYAYHTALSWWIFALAGVLMVFIALVTVSFQMLRAVLVSPAIILHNNH